MRRLLSLALSFVLYAAPVAHLSARPAPLAQGDRTSFSCTPGHRASHAGASPAAPPHRHLLTERWPTTWVRAPASRPGLLRPQPPSRAAAAATPCAPSFCVSVFSAAVLLPACRR